MLQKTETLSTLKKPGRFRKFFGINPDGKGGYPQAGHSLEGIGIYKNQGSYTDKRCVSPAGWAGMRHPKNGLAGGKKRSNRGEKLVKSGKRSAKA